MRLRTVLSLTAMIAAAALLHAHAWSRSRPDDCGIGFSDDEAIAAGYRPVCGDSYLQEFPVQFIAAAVIIVGGAVHLSRRASGGSSPSVRSAKAAAIGLLAYQTVHPLTFTLSDWHGQPVIIPLVLTVLAFPLGLPLILAGGFFFEQAKGAPYETPYLGGDPVYGQFSTAYAAGHLALATGAYLQWFVVGPWLARGAWRALRRGISAVRRKLDEDP